MAVVVQGALLAVTYRFRTMTRHWLALIRPGHQYRTLPYSVQPIVNLMFPRHTAARIINPTEYYLRSGSPSCADIPLDAVAAHYPTCLSIVSAPCQNRRLPATSHHDAHFGRRISIGRDCLSLMRKRDLEVDEWTARVLI